MKTKVENSEDSYKEEQREYEFAEKLWKEKKSLFGVNGNPGITYQKTVSRKENVEHLIYRDVYGNLLAFLQYRGEHASKEKRGDLNLRVHSDFWRKGIGSLLLEEAYKHWPVDLNAQEYTIFGIKFINSFRNSHPFDKEGKISEDDKNAPISYKKIKKDLLLLGIVV